MTQGGPSAEINLWRSLWGRIRSHRRSGFAALLGLYFLSGLYYIPADEQGVRLRFGRLSQAHIEPGLHYSWPFPVDRIVRLRINQVQRLSVGEIDVSRVLGTTDGSADNYLLSGDRNLVQLNASMQFYIDDPEAYLFRTEDLPGVLTGAFAAALSAAVAETDVDSILTVERLALQNRVKASLQDKVSRLGLGVNVTTISLESVSPPSEVRGAFLDVANAREDRNRIVQEANGYASEVVPRARGEAQELMEESSIYRTARISEAVGASDRFTRLWEQYRHHRQTTRTRLFLETVEVALARVQKVIVDEGEGQTLDVEILSVPRSN